MFHKFLVHYISVSKFSKIKMDLVICNSGIIRRIKFNLPKLEEMTIRPKLFLEGCKNLATFLGYFGMALRSIQYNILANTELISKWYKENDDYTNEDLTMALAKEFQRNEIHMNQASYYLMKCLVFCVEVMHCLVEDCEEESLMQSIEEAYDKTLGPYQNKLPNWLFRVSKISYTNDNETSVRQNQTNVNHSTTAQEEKKGSYFTLIITLTKTRSC
ncbi:uncharacterized protein [Halyomorpha halys]|uniref:uncharacterized protein isoform X2 n=1 Tax=Halyomorpha halys TaxID=286706 RepID=UPI0034D270F2